MKKFYFALAAVAAIFSGCSKEVDNLNPEPVVPNEKTVTLKASVSGLETKVSIDNDGFFRWQSTDMITVVTENDEIRQFSVKEISNAGTEANFEGIIPEGDDIKYALYPASISHIPGGDELYFQLDDDVCWKADATNIPMLGVATSGSSVSFVALGGVLKLVLFNIPDKAKHLQFSATNKQISGDFYIEDVTAAAPKIVTDTKAGNNNELVIDFSEDYSSSKVFYIPLPTGAIDGFTVALLDDNLDELFSVTSEKTLNVTANKLIIAPVMNCTSPETVLSEVFDAPGSSTETVASYDKAGQTVYPGATISYSIEGGNSNTKIYQNSENSANTAGGAAPGELFLAKKASNVDGVFNITGIPTNLGNSMTLSFISNSNGGNAHAVSTSTEGVTVGDRQVAGTTRPYTISYAITIDDNIAASTFDLIFTNSSTANARIDDILVQLAGQSFTAPTITAEDDELTIAVGNDLTASTGVTLANAVDGLGISCQISYPDENEWIKSAVIANNTLVVTAKASNPTNADYTATITLMASGAVAKTISVKQESSLVPNPTDLAAVAGNATVDVTWTGDVRATSYVAFLHTSATQTPAEGGVDISENIAHVEQAYIIDDYAVTNDQTYYLYVKVSGVEEGYVAPTEFVEVSFTPSIAKGTADNPYLASELYDLVAGYAAGKGPEGTVYVKGYVSQASNPTSNYQNYYISDDGTTTKQFQAYRGKGIGGADITNENRVNVGDWVVACGTAVNYGGNTPEFSQYSQIVTHNPKLAAPTFNPAAGTYYSAQNVVLSATVSDATIYYTTDGTEPTTGSTVYTGPIVVEDDLTIKAFAVKEGFVNSAVAVAAYDIEAGTKLDTPVVVVDSFNHNSISFSWSAIEHASGYQVSTDLGTTWSETQEGLTFTWTGLEANTSYTIQVKAIGTASGQYTDSDAASKSQTTATPKTLVSIELTTAPTKTTYNVNEAFSLAGAVVTANYSDASTADVTSSCTTEYDFSTIGDKTVTISYTEGDITRTTTCEVTVANVVVDVLNYAWTGITDTSYSSATLSGSASGVTYSVQAAGGNESIQLRSNNSNSGIVTTTTAGTIKKITIKWNSNTDDARKLDIYGKHSAYSAPSDLYSANTQGTKVKTFTKSDGNGNYTFEADYEYIGIRSYSGALYIDEIDIEWGEPAAVATPTFSIAEGTYYAAQSVEISCSTDGATIYYTTDGSEPTSSSSTYSSAIAVNTSMTIKAIAVKGSDVSDIASATYTLKVATPSFSPAGGSYTSAQSVAISCATDGATIRYTTDGTEPTGSSSVYSSAISVSETQTVKAIAFKDGWSNSAVATATYTISSGGGDGPSDQSTNYTGNVTLSTSGGSNASTCTIYIGSDSYSGIKAGTSNKAGAVKVSVPSGTKYLHLHVAAWNGETVSLSVTPTGYSSAISLTADSGVSGNSPFTLSGNPSTSDYYKVITFTDALEEATDLTFTATSGKRFVIWGVYAE